MYQQVRLITVKDNYLRYRNRQPNAAMQCLLLVGCTNTASLHLAKRYLDFEIKDSFVISLLMKKLRDIENFLSYKT